MRQLSLTQFCDCPRTDEALAQHHAGTLTVRDVRADRADVSFELTVDGQIPWGAAAEGSPARITAEGEIERR